MPSYSDYRAAHSSQMLNSPRSSIYSFDGSRRSCRSRQKTWTAQPCRLAFAESLLAMSKTDPSAGANSATSEVRWYVVVRLPFETKRLVGVPGWNLRVPDAPSSDLLIDLSQKHVNPEGTSRRFDNGVAWPSPFDGMLLCPRLAESGVAVPTEEMETSADSLASALANLANLVHATRCCKERGNHNSLTASPTSWQPGSQAAWGCPGSLPPGCARRDVGEYQGCGTAGSSAPNGPHYYSMCMIIARPSLAAIWPSAGLARSAL